MYVLTPYHTPAVLMRFLTKPFATFLPYTTKTSDNAAISPFCRLSLMAWGFASDHTWVGIVTLSFSASNSSRIFCRPSLPFPMYLTTARPGIFSLSQEWFCSTLTTPFLSVLAPGMMMSRYCRAISIVTFWCVIMVVAPLAFVFALRILMWAGACWWKIALSIADASSLFILLGGDTQSSLHESRHLSTMLIQSLGRGQGLQAPSDSPFGINLSSTLWLE